MKTPEDQNQKIYIDFLNEPKKGHFSLDTLGTRKDLQKYKIILSEGLRLRFWSDDVDADGNVDNLSVEGIVKYERDLDGWIAEIDTKEIRHESGMNK